MGVTFVGIGGSFARGLRDSVRADGKVGILGEGEGQTVGIAGDELGIAESAAGAGVPRGTGEEAEGVAARAVAGRGGRRGDAGGHGGGGVSGQLSQRKTARKRGAEHARCAGGRGVRAAG